MYDLKFNPENYQIKRCELDGREVIYRAFENIVYCANPVSAVQKLNLYVPEVYYQGESINGYQLHTAPIFAPNTVGGYMEGPAMQVGEDYFGHKPNTAFEALYHGYVVMCAGIRGRNTGRKSNEFFVGGTNDEKSTKEGMLTGRAPALIVDMKAAIRYLRWNKDLVPGDVEKIITNGTSAGGALSALAGATGNAKEYEPYLKAIGAAKARDDIFAASCYCPIHNLENADAAYEWLFEKETTCHRIKFEKTPQGVKKIAILDELDEEQKLLSKKLKAAFPSYVNQLQLQDETGNKLTSDENGEGSFKDYVMNFVAKITRMKRVPAFDSLTLECCENEEFGDENVFARHFTEFSMKHSKLKAEMADEEKIKLLNPIPFIENGNCDVAKNWRIRHGAFDRDTSLAIPVILATLLQNKGYQVDFCLPWGLPHSGDYDLKELFEWIDCLAKNQKSEK